MTLYTEQVLRGEIGAQRASCRIVWTEGKQQSVEVIQPLIKI